MCNEGPVEIVIDLSRSREATSLKSKKDMIQKNAFNSFEKLVAEILDRIPSSQEDRQSEYLRMRTHDVITIDGNRGSGKTTFILSAYQLLEDRLKSRIQFLGIIDPTLIETREHVFVTIVSLIKRKVDKSYANSFDPCLRKKIDVWRERLRNLARGMTLLDGVGQNHMNSDAWIDEHFALEEGLKKAQSGRDLELAFHEFIEVSLDILKKDAFLLAFDDIDTDFAKGWPVLELMRKYLTTPQFITILSGDLNLYKTLVEKHQWKHLGLDLAASKDSREPYISMVDELVDQYLLKILRTSNRIELHPISYYVARGDWSVWVKKDAFAEQIELDDLLYLFCESVLCLKVRSDISRVVELLLNLTPRTLVSLLSGFAEQSDSQWEGGDPRVVVERMADVFLVWLQKYGFSRQFFMESDAKRIITYLLANFHKQKMLPQALAFQPIFSDQGKNNTVISLAPFLMHSMAHAPSSYFDYLFRGCLTAAVMREGKSSAENERYIEHVGILNSSSPGDIARKHISFMYPTSFPHAKDRVALLNGTLQLSSNNTDISKEVINALYNSDDQPKFEALDIFSSKVSTKNRMRFKGVYVNTPESLSANLVSWHKYLAMLPISYVRNGDSTYTHFSIFNLLASIESLLVGGNLKKQLRMVGSTQELLASWESTSEREAAKESIGTDDLGVTLEPLPAGFKEFRKAFLKWKRHSLALNSQTQIGWLDSAWQRFYSSLKKLPHALLAEEKFAGKIMHQWIVMFLNSFLVEEARGEFNLLERTPVTNDSVLIANLTRVYAKLDDKNSDQKSSDGLSVFEWLFACPIWSHFLDVKSPVIMWHAHAMNRLGVRVDQFDCLTKETPPVYWLNRKVTDDQVAGPIMQIGENLVPYLNSLISVGMGSLANAESQFGTQDGGITEVKKSNDKETIEDYPLGENFEEFLKVTGLDDVRDVEEVFHFIPEMYKNIRTVVMMRFCDESLTARWVQAGKPKNQLDILKIIRAELLNQKEMRKEWGGVLIPRKRTTKMFKEFYLPAFLHYVIEPYEKKQKNEV